MRRLLVLTALMGLAACAGTAETGPAAPLPPPPATTEAAPPPPPAIVGRATFLCDDGTRMSALFEDGPAQVRLTMIDNTTLVLPRQASGSGYRYSDGDHALYGQGVSATFEAPGRDRTICTDVTEAK